MNLEYAVQISSILVAIAALYIAWRTAKQTERQAEQTERQAEQTEKALIQEQELSRASTVLHFTHAFAELIEKNGKPTPEKFQDEEWAYKYWGLQSTEFYFFHHGVIPQMLYALWMVDIVDLYSSRLSAWESHEKYLKFYVVLYPEMKEFFSQLRELSKIEAQSERHHAVRDYVMNWIERNLKTSISQ